MRCPSCAAETPDGSRFCGICGYKIERAHVSPPPPVSSSGPRGQASGASGADVSSSSSAMSLPVSRGAWWLRVLALLLVDAALLGAGIVLILSYVEARDRASHAARPAAGHTASRPAEPARAQAPDESMGPQIFQAVDGLRPDIQRCYSEATQAAGQDMPPEGLLTIGLTIAADGRVTRAAAVRDDLGVASLTRCVEALFQGLRFPERPGGAPVETTWPLRFQAPG